MARLKLTDEGLCATCENALDSRTHREHCADGEGVNRCFGHEDGRTYIGCPVHGNGPAREIVEDNNAPHVCTGCKKPLGAIWVQAMGGQRACCFHCMAEVL